MAFAFRFILIGFYITTERESSSEGGTFRSEMKANNLKFSRWGEFFADFREARLANSPFLLRRQQALPHVEGHCLDSAPASRFKINEAGASGA